MRLDNVHLIDTISNINFALSAMIIIIFVKRYLSQAGPELELEG